MRLRIWGTRSNGNIILDNGLFTWDNRTTGDIAGVAFAYDNAQQSSMTPCIPIAALAQQLPTPPNEGVVALDSKK